MSGKQKFGGRATQARPSSGFAFIQTEYRPHESLQEHCHEDAYVSIVLRGSYCEKCESASWECQSGDVVFHGPGERHSDVFHECGAHVLNFEILPTFLTRVRQCGIDTERRLTVKNPHCIQLGLRLAQELTSADPVGSLAAEGILIELIAEIFRKREAKNSDWLERIRKTLDDDYCQPAGLFELAQEAQVHPAHLARAFRHRFGCSIGDYVRKLRVEAARQELQNSNAPIVDIAARTGFSDQSHLCRMIKKYTGMSPRDLRSGRLGFC